MPGELLAGKRGEGSFISSSLRIMRTVADAEIFYKQVVARVSKTCIIKY